MFNWCAYADRLSLYGGTNKKTPGLATGGRLGGKLMQATERPTDTLRGLYVR